MEKKSFAWVYVIFTIFIWASLPVVSKLLLNGMSSFQILFWTMPIAAITLFLSSVFNGKWKVIKSYKTKDYLTFLWLGFIGIFLVNGFLITAFMFAPAQEISIINYFWPIAVLLFAVIILKEKLTPKKIIGIVLAFIGVIIIASQGLKTFSLNLGALLAFLNALLWGLFSVLFKKYNYEAFTSMALFNAVAFIFTIPIILFTGLTIPSFYEWMGLIWIGAVIWGLCYVFWLKALRKIETAKLSTAIYLVPALSLVYIAIFLKEQILLSSIIGLMIVVLGIIIQNKK